MVTPLALPLSPTFHLTPHSCRFLVDETVGEVLNVSAATNTHRAAAADHEARGKRREGGGGGASTVAAATPPDPGTLFSLSFGMTAAGEGRGRPIRRSATLALLGAPAAAGALPGDPTTRMDFEDGLPSAAALRSSAPVAVADATTHQSVGHAAAGSAGRVIPAEVMAGGALQS